ncbi:MAG: hypothetical protein COU11_01465 [Candidatus Harrisonbacteria bacterium CG10_big_fil_rev_8_21_14_0_10_49_15]|uniref:Type II toxin-antitoxin system HicB family antitoxin n=1 Tax=Candidatus Harrisonbacteria bacterium CG10_big_fil_rev_8_21_14_0_10_49_15 TaxID=1974587 RepID=A0A2H0ULB5_9BACT|nr:MAG: hypothetical protein COU11_01465 [Candidatus Harrisonbacteria bacterium CG10_big_fil_rev_8_21_14_0_10_49_15]
MQSIIQFHISKGVRQYVAEGANLPIVTQGKTMDELLKNIHEAVTLHLQDENLADLGLAPKPSVLVNMELPALTDA